MKQYQLFILTLEGRVRTRYDLISADDDDVKRRAEKFYTVYAVEVWDGPRRVIRIPSVPSLRLSRSDESGRS